MTCPSDNSCPINVLEGVTLHCMNTWKPLCCSSQTPSSLIPDFFFLKERCVECLTRTCSDKVFSVPFLPCSNFQSSAMFEGSERVEVEGGSTDSTVASSISACKKVNKTTRVVSCWMTFYTCALCVPVCQPCLLLPSVHLSIMSFPSLICCVCPAMQQIFISSSGVSVTPRGCVIRRTARPSG